MKRILILPVVTALILPLCGVVLSAPREILLRVESTGLAWAETHLIEKLQWQLSRDPDWRIVLSSNRDMSEPRFPSARYDLDSLLDWGREKGGRYLMLVTVRSERLDTRKTFSIPLVLHQYETIGVIEGEWRFLDLKRGRLLAAEPFIEELGGRRVIQGDPDNRKEDPGLHIPAPEKTTFFGELEDKLAERLAMRARALARSR